MRKEVFIIFLLNLSLVSAQEVMIGGKSYSLLFLSPLIILAIVMLFLFFRFVFKMFGKIKLPSLKGKEIRLFSKKKEDTKTELGLGLDFRKEIEDFKAKCGKLEVKEAFNQFNGLVKDYLAFNYKLNKQFTFEEIEPILEKKGKKFVSLIQDITDLKYSGKAVNRDNLNELVLRFSKLVGTEKIEKPKKEEVKVSLFNKIDIKGFTKLKFSFKNLLKSNKEKSTVFDFKVDGINIQVTRKHSKFNPFSWYHDVKDYMEKREQQKNRDLVEKLIRKGRNVARKDWREANRIYNKTLGIYYKLNTGEEQKVAGALIELYGDVERAKLDEESREMAEVTEKIQGILETQKIIHKEPEKEIIRHSHDTFKHLRKSVLGWKAKVTENVDSFKKNLDNKFKHAETKIDKDVHTLLVKSKENNELFDHKSINKKIKEIKVKIPEEHKNKLFTFKEVSKPEVHKLSKKLFRRRAHEVKKREIELPVLTPENPVLGKIKNIKEHIEAISKEGSIELKLRERELINDIRALLHFHKKRHLHYDNFTEKYGLSENLQIVYDDVPKFTENKAKVNELLLERQKLLNKFNRTQVDAKKDYIKHLLARIDDYEKRRMDVIRAEIQKPIVKINSKNIGELRKQEEDIVNRLSSFEKKKLEDVKKSIKENILEFSKEEYRIGKPLWQVNAEKVKNQTSRQIKELSKQEKALFDKLTDVKNNVQLQEPKWEQKVEEIKTKTSKKIGSLSKEQAKLFKKMGKI
ncbi:MAG: hypothetical protein PHE43_04385 [Candidatus Nanoarchaeia archaeon]|nr:hypothetical protein [Candidatus Nanoarchaeia archaeon]